MGIHPIDLAGKRFGNLTVIEQLRHRVRGYVHWVCICECGNKVERRSSSLISRAKQGKDQYCSVMCPLISSGERKVEMSHKVKEYFVRMGRKGGQIGGKRRAEMLTAERRSEIARNAVRARWDRAIGLRNSEFKETD